MRLHSRSTAGIAVAGALAVAAAGIVPAVAAPSAKSSWKTKTLAKTLASPKGVTLDANGNVVVAQNAFGEPSAAAKLVKYYTSGKDKGELKRFGAKRSVVAIVLSPKGGYWTIGTDGVLYKQKTIGAKPKKVRDLRAWAATHPDPYNQADGPATESNPFGLAVTKAGNALVTDAAANSVLRVTPKGKVSLVARFAPQNMKTDHVPPGGPPLPPTMVTESVPTGIAVSAKGTIYVGELRGFPFRPGTSHIYKLASGTTNAVCSATAAIKIKKCKIAHNNLTAIASLAVNPAGGLAVLEYAKDGILAFEGGCQTAAGCPDAVLLKLKDGKRSEIRKGAFSEPGSIVAYGKNRFYVTDHILTPGTGRLTRLAWS